MTLANCKHDRALKQLKRLREPTVLVAPSQTSFRTGLGQAWVQRSDAAASIFARADAILGDELGLLPSAYIRAHFQDDENCKRSTRRVDIPQIAIYIVAVACWHGLTELGVVHRDDIIASIGLSFGEIVLLTIADALTFEQGLRFVARRARAMQDVVRTHPGGLVALITTDEAVLETILTACREDAVLSILRVKNSTTLLSGSFDALDRASIMATRMGITCFRPNDCSAFHSELMRPAVTEIEHALRHVEIKEPQFQIISNVTARPFEKQTIHKGLMDNLCSRILWRESLDFILSDKVCWSARWLVLEPAEVLAKELTRFSRPLKVSACDQPPDNTDE